MAHFAKLDENNMVLAVVVVDNAFAPTEADGIKYLEEIGATGKWIQTSYNTRSGVHQFGGTPFRGTFAGPGMMYDPIKDEFVYPVIIEE